MILRKPYAFLIKYFKVIHLVLSLALGYICYRTWNIAGLFSKYANNEIKVDYFDNLKDKYIPFHLYIIIIIIIAISVTIIILMNKKKKPINYYIINTIVYALLIGLYMYLASIINELWYVDIETRTAKIISDITTVMYIIQIPCLIVSIVRTVGFNIKQFNFKKDLIELNSSDEDRAEFEFEINLDTENIRTGFRKWLRLLKYNYKENKLIINTTIIVTVFIVIGVVVFSVINREKIYKENQTFNSNSFEMKVTSSYKTMLDNKGNKISDKYGYIIVNLQLRNKTDQARELIIKNTNLKVNEYTSYSPTKSLYDKFMEFGTPYYVQEIKPNEIRKFILVYEIDKAYYDNEMTFQYLNSITSSDGVVNYEYLKVDLSPVEFNKNKNVSTVKLNEKLIFNDSLLNDSYIIIKDIDFKDSYYYDYVDCNNGKCLNKAGMIQPNLNNNSAYDLMVMKINYELHLDSSLDKGYQVDNFIEKLGNIRFTVNGKEYDHKINLYDITPYTIKNYSYLTVRKKLELADEIYLDFVIRDKTYTCIIKEKEI